MLLILLFIIIWVNNSDTQAYFRDPTTKKFFGVEATPVEGAAITYTTFMKDRKNLWDLVTEVEFNLYHEITGRNFEFAKDWSKTSDLPSSKGSETTFTVLNFGDNIWLVGGDDKVLKSSDRGKTWETITAIGLINTWWCRSCNDKLFVANKNNVYTSTDGINWTSVHTVLRPTTEGFLAVKATSGIRFIASNGVVVSSSADGETWTEAAPLKPDVTDGTRWSLRDRLSTAYTATHMYVLAGGLNGTQNANIWKADFNTPTVWTEVTADGGFGIRQNAKTLYYSDTEEMLIIGGTRSDVWSSKNVKLD